MNYFCRIHSREVTVNGRSIYHLDDDGYKAPTMRSNLKRGRRK